MICSRTRLRQATIAAGVWFALPILALGQSGTGVLRVSAGTGSDLGSCGSASQPCASIQRAVDLALDGEEIRVAGGAYSPPASFSSCTIGNAAVVCVVDKELAIRGGFSESDWASSEPEIRRTTIDGGGLVRGVLVEETTGQSASLLLEGITIREGYAVPRDGDINAFGGGLSAVAPSPQKLVIVLRDVVFESNQAVGADTVSGAGGFAAGGALSLRNTELPSRLERVRFLGNAAQGGSGPARGGLAVGGALYTYLASLSACSLAFSDNTAQAGDSTGTGVSGGLLADAQGGAAAFQLGTWIDIEHVTAAGNQAIGGDASGSAGGAFAGALYGEGQAGSPTSVSLYRALLEDNSAAGGSGETGGIGRGGAIMMGKWTSFSASRGEIIGNHARTGDGSVNHGSGGGGGVAVTGGPDVGSSSLDMGNFVLADNRVELGSGGGSKGGGGGGLFVQNLSSASLRHCTFARNSVSASPLTGQAIALAGGAGPVDLEIDYSIIADHTDYVGAQAVFVASGTSAAFLTGLLAANGIDIGGLGDVSGTETMLSTASADFRSPGEPTFDYHLLPTSPAVDQASPSGETWDFDGEARDSAPEIGADEQSSLLFRSSFESGTTWWWSLTSSP